MRTKNILLYVIICLVIIAGVAVWSSKGFSRELQYSSRYQIRLYKHTSFDISEVENIANEVLGNTRHFVQKSEIYGNNVSIVSEEMTEEQRNKIVEKFNEKYEDSELEPDNVEIRYIPFTRIIDIVKHYIVPGIVSLVVVLVYFLIRFKKLGWKTVAFKTVGLPIAAELLLFSIISIARIPFGRTAIAVSLGLYLATIMVLTCIFESQRNKYIEENDRKED